MLPNLSRTWCASQEAKKKTTRKEKSGTFLFHKDYKYLPHTSSALRVRIDCAHSRTHVYGRADTSAPLVCCVFHVFPLFLHSFFNLFHPPGSSQATFPTTFNAIDIFLIRFVHMPDKNKLRNSQEEIPRDLKNLCCDLFTSIVEKYLFS